MSSYLIHLDLTQTSDGGVQGTEDIQTQGSYVYSAEIQLSGIVIGHEFIFQETLVTDENSPPDFHWLLKAANLQVSSDGSAIDGPWSAPSDNAGTISLVPAPNNPPTGGTTATTLQAGPEATVDGQPVALSAFVSPTTDATGSPTGQITFRDGNTTLGTANLSAGSATTTSSLQVGPHDIVATYGGDANSLASAGSVQQTVRSAEYATVTVLSSSNQFPGVGQPVTFTATVKPTARISGTPTGSVTFSAGTTILGTVPLRDGKAKFMTSALPFGRTAIQAIYNGEQNLLPSSSPILSEIVGTSRTKTTVASSHNPARFGNIVVFRATVTTAGHGGGAPSGTVTFLDGSSILGTVTLAGGKASLVINRLSAGPHRVEASYSGRPGFASSTSPPLKQSVKQSKASSANFLKLRN